jgi:hypothetical protein
MVRRGEIAAQPSRVQSPIVSRAPDRGVRPR